jgi:glycine cleavage system regulatory protein
VTTSLVLTVIGSDHPGIVNLLSDVAQRFGANWAGSRMATLAGQFAGMVHFEVPDQSAESLASALRGLVSSGLHVVIVMGDSSAAPAGQRIVRLELVGNDLPGIVRERPQADGQGAPKRSFKSRKAALQIAATAGLSVLSTACKSFEMTRRAGEGMPLRRHRLIRPPPNSAQSAP